MTKKRAHIVYAHPEPSSFVAAMRDIVKAALEAEGWQTSLTDLTQSNFQAVAGPDDFKTRARSDYLVYPIEQRHAWTGGGIASDIASEVESICESDLLVMVFPVFWYSVPAQMKGWIDRVFLSGVFYGGRRIYDKGGMHGKKAFVVTSLGGREHMFGPQSIHGDLNDMLKHLLQGTLGYVGYSVYQPFFAYHVPYLDDSNRLKILSELSRETRNLDKRSFLKIPSTEGFDEEFHPRSNPSSK